MEMTGNGRIVMGRHAAKVSNPGLLRRGHSCCKCGSDFYSSYHFGLFMVLMDRTS